MDDRSKYVGSSDVGAAIGVNPYKSPLSLYAEKLKLAPKFEGNEATEWGMRLEQTIADKFAETHGYRVERPGDQPFVGAEDWIQCRPDGLIMESLDEKTDQVVAGLEIKTVGIRSAHRWGESGNTEDIPAEYLAQIRWCQMILGRDWWLAVLIGGNEYREYFIERDPELEQGILAAACRFWQCVQDRIPPPTTEAEQDAQALALIYRKDAEPLEYADEEAELIAENLRAARAEFDRAEAAKRLWENRIKERIGDHAGIQTGIGAIRWTRNRDMEKTNWYSAFVELCEKYALPDQQAKDIIALHTKTVPGARVLRVPADWKKNQGEE